MAKMIFEVPEETRKAFKIKCLQNDTTMKDQLIRYMKEYAKKGGGKKKK